MEDVTSINVAIMIDNTMVIAVNISTTDDAHNLQWDEMNASERYAYIVKHFYVLNSSVKSKIDGCMETNTNLHIDGLVFNAKGASKLCDICECSLQQLKVLKLAFSNNTHAKGVKASKNILKYGVNLFNAVFAADEENIGLMFSTMTGRAI